MLLVGCYSQVSCRSLRALPCTPSLNLSPAVVHPCRHTDIGVCACMYVQVHSVTLRVCCGVLVVVVRCEWQCVHLAALPVMCSPCCPPGNVCVWQELPFVKGCGDGIEAVRVDLATGEFKHAKKNPFKHHVQCNTVIHPPPTRSARHLRTWLAGTYARARTHAHTTAV